MTILMTRHDRGVFALPAHQDTIGEWIVQYNVFRSKEGIHGGEVRLTTSYGSLLHQSLLAEPLDAYFVDNQRLYHGATAIGIPQKGPVRDILILHLSAYSLKAAMAAPTFSRG